MRAFLAWGSILGGIVVLAGCGGGSSDANDGAGGAAGAAGTEGGAAGAAGSAGSAGGATEVPAADEVGPFAVGVVTLEIDDGESPDRVLPVEVWYPAVPAEGAEVVVYPVGDPSNPLVEAPSPAGAVRDAPGATDAGPFPVIVFSHGNMGVRIQSLYLTEHLASHGFVVASPDHVGNTFFDSGTPAFEVARLRPGDASRALDAVEEASAGDGPLAGLAKDGGAGIAGHSFGGFTTFRVAGATIDAGAIRTACEADPGSLFCDGYSPDTNVPASARDDRFVVAVPQAPGGAAVIGGGFADISIPTMVQGGTVDMTTPWEAESQAPFEQIQAMGSSHLIVLEGAGHFTYSNMCQLVDLVPGAAALFSNVFGDGCGDTNVPWAEAHVVINGYTTAFFLTELAGKSGYEEWLDASTPQSDIVSVHEVR